MVVDRGGFYLNLTEYSQEVNQNAKCKEKKKTFLVIKQIPTPQFFS